MAMITIRVSDEEKAWLDQMATFHGLTLSELMKRYSMEQLEDEYDAQVGEAALKRFKAGDQETISIENMMTELGIDS